jgi:hypothetical protein
MLLLDTAARPVIWFRRLNPVHNLKHVRGQDLWVAEVTRRFGGFAPAARPVRRRGNPWRDIEMAASIIVFLFGGITLLFSLQLPLGTLHMPGSAKKGMEDPAFVKNAEDMTVQLAYLGPAEFGKLMAQDDERYAKLEEAIEK